MLCLLGVLALRAGPSPVINIHPTRPAIGRSTTIQITVEEPSRGLSLVKVEFIQGDRVETLAEKSYPYPGALSAWGVGTARDQIDVIAGRETLPGLKSGTAVVRVTAGRIGAWFRQPAPVVQEVTLPVRLQPPSIQHTGIQVYVAQGGCEVAVYRVGQTVLRDGVRVGELWFPGYPLPGAGKQDRFAFFAVPYDQDNPKVRLVAVDDAGNEAEISFIDRFFPKPFKKDTLQISDSFLSKVVPEILSHTPAFQDRGSPLDNYLAINGDLRRSNAARLIELAQKSQPDFLWTRPYQSLPNAKVMSAFADRRTYVYDGRVIDHQDHLGYDLAVTQRTPVPASNSGTVVLAEYFGIYGNSVVIDHGYGLMTLYGHLASLDVTAGQAVARGETLGHTGATGLAAGDHLHFTVLLQGLPVNPVEWWDGHWIRDRIARKLGSAIPFH